MSKSNSSGGPSGWLSGAVFLVFLTLKLTGTIDWSWWWITAPLWVGVLVYLVVLGGIAFIAFNKNDRRRLP